LRHWTADSISSAVTRDMTPKVKWRDPVGRMILGWIVEGSNALKAVTLLRNATVLRGKHMKCVFAGDLGFIVVFDSW
jgi:hypothetical protein